MPRRSRELVACSPRAGTSQSRNSMTTWRASKPGSTILESSHSVSSKKSISRNVPTSSARPAVNMIVRSESVRRATARTISSCASSNRWKPTSRRWDSISAASRRDGKQRCGPAIRAGRCSRPESNWCKPWDGREPSCWSRFIQAASSPRPSRNAALTCKAGFTRLLSSRT